MWGGGGGGGGGHITPSPPAQFLQLCLKWPAYCKMYCCWGHRTLLWGHRTLLWGHHTLLCAPLCKGIVHHTLLGYIHRGGRARHCVLDIRWYPIYSGTGLESRVFVSATIGLFELISGPNFRSPFTYVCSKPGVSFNASLDGSHKQTINFQKIGAFKGTYFVLVLI